MNANAAMEGKRVLVTGAGTGIGREIALEFARCDADVALHFAHSGKGAVTVMEEIRAMGRRCEAFQADFDSVEEVMQLADKALGFLGKIDCLVNNAGITFNKPFLQVTPEQFDTLYHVNVRAQFVLTQRVAESMLRDGGGAICNLTSIHGLQGAPEHSVYAGTKGAIVAFTRTVSVELAPKGVRVNAIAPGWIIVENHYKAMDINEDTVTNGIPAGFLGQPDDVAQLALYLASDAARYVIGQTFMIDGGQMAVMPGVGDFRQPVNARFGAQYVPGL